MGRLIDIDVLFDYFGNDAIDEITRSNIEYFVCEEGTVEAILKADYENRLKADMVAILTELQLEIEEKATELCDDGWWLTYNDIIQQKIDKLKENSDDIQK